MTCNFPKKCLSSRLAGHVVLQLLKALTAQQQQVRNCKFGRFKESMMIQNGFSPVTLPLLKL